MSLREKFPGPSVFNDDPMASEYFIYDTPSTPEGSQLALGAGEAMAGEQETVTEEVKEWVSESIRLVYQTWVGENGEKISGYVWCPVSADDPFLVEHKNEILLEAIGKFKMQPGPLLVELVDMITGGDAVSEETMSDLMLDNPYLIVDKPDLFPDFRFTETGVEAMIDAGDAWLLISKWKLVEPACLQRVVDAALNERSSHIEFIIRELPATVAISEQQVIRAIQDEAAMVYRLVSGGMLSWVRSNTNILRQLYIDGYYIQAMKLISDELLIKLSFTELVDVFGSGPNFSMIDRLVNLGRLDNEESVYNFIASVGLANVLPCVRPLPALVQSCVFKAVATTPNICTEWIQNISYFCNLQKEDYNFIIDHIDDCIDQGISSDTIRVIFGGVNGDARGRFEHVVLPKILKLENEAQAREVRNIQRHVRRKFEDEYFMAGNIRLAHHGYEGELSRQEVIDGLEHGHCVRAIGVLKDIANDPTRTNEIVGIESQYQKATAELGANINVNQRVTLTEHEALRQLMKFLEDSHKEAPDDPLFETLSNDLSFIGEKEYAEAAKGIAMYWKWFLDQDDNNQLYVDTVVSTSHESIKSDTYMFDRILEHFSDDDMEKYWGRLLTKGADIIQDDPSKVKVVLLDDWTISGEQLRDGYQEFLKGHINLISSVEVQLIVASAERVAMGIEKMAYHIPSMQTKECGIPIVTRAYYVAHKADTTNSYAVGARITGSHSSVDFGFVSDLDNSKRAGKKYPLLANIIRGYRLPHYKPVHINRLRKIYGIKEDSNG